MASPVAVGGLGLSKLKDCNVALLSKWVWRFRCEHLELWRSVIESLHNTKRCWDSLPFNRSLTGVWKVLVGAVTKISVSGVGLNRLFKGEVGDERVIRFWIDSSACEEPLKDRFPRLFKLEKEKKSLVKERFDTGNSNRRFRNICNWNRASFSTEELNEWNSLVRLLSPIVLGSNRDKWRWAGASDGLFTVKSAKAFLRSCVDYSERCVFKWSKWVTNKCNVFMWRASMDRLPTMVAFKARNVVFDSITCVLCGEADETIEHVLCCCSWAIAICYRIGIRCKASRIFLFSVKDLFEVDKYVGLDKRGRKIFKGIVFVTCWCLWKARHEKKFERETIIVETVFQDIKAFSLIQE